MKIKNLRYILSTAILSTTLSLTGCGSNSDVSEKELSIESLLIQSEEHASHCSHDVFVDFNIAETELHMFLLDQIQNQKEETEADKAIIEISGFLSNLPAFSYDHSTNTISISGKDITEDDITDGFYSNFNLLLSQDCEYKLELSSLGNEIDFSKLDLTNVKELSLDNCSDKFNYDIFANQQYSSLKFFDISAKNTIKIVKNSTTSETDISYNNDSYQDRLQFLKFLVDNDICMNSFFQLGNCNEINSEIYRLLGKLNTKRVASYEWQSRNFVPKIDFDFVLNDKIEYFNIDFAGQTELGNINIVSNNPNLSIKLFDVYLTENTNFSIPDDIKIEFYGTYTDINAFNGLNNVSYLYYHDNDQNSYVYWDNGESFEDVIKKIEDLHGSALVRR